jgi:hypothetical protein
MVLSEIRGKSGFLVISMQFLALFGLKKERFLQLLERN